MSRENFVACNFAEPELTYIRATKDTYWRPDTGHKDILPIFFKLQYACIPTSLTLIQRLSLTAEHSICLCDVKQSPGRQVNKDGDGGVHTDCEHMCTATVAICKHT